MNVRVGFSRGRSFVARWICKLTRADISHSFFLVEDAEGAWAYEAVPGPGGFRKQSWEQYKRDNAVKDLVELAWPHTEVKAALDGMLGTQYHVWKFLWMGVLLTLQQPVEPDASRFDCVTSVWRIATRFGASLHGNPLSPAELREKLLAVKSTP